MATPFLSKSVLALAGGALALAGCSRDEAIPSPEASYSRTVVYLDQAKPARHDTTYQAPALQATAKLDAKSCVVFLQAATGKAGLAFGIPRAQLTPGFVGSYAFRAPINPSQGPNYRYWVNAANDPSGSNSWVYESWWLTSTGAATGTLDITAYDTKRQLLSGRFKLALTGTYDPRASSTEFSTRRCDLTLAGTFANVLVADTN